MSSSKSEAGAPAAEMQPALPTGIQDQVLQLVEGMHEAVIAHRAGAIVWANPAAAAVIGVARPEELYGRQVLEFVHPDDQQSIVEDLVAAMENRNDLPLRGMRFIRADGTIRESEISGCILSRDEALIVCIGRDLTEKRQLERQLALSDRMASLGLLAASVAHEISNPLGCVQQSIEAMAEPLRELQQELSAMRLPAGAAAVGALGRVQAACDGAREGVERAGLILRDLKLLARPEEEPPRPVRLDKVVERSLSIAAAALLQRATLVRELKPTPSVRATEPRLCQVFLNLLINAAQAGTGTAAEDQITVRTGSRHGLGFVEIADNGKGIAPEDLPRIFEPFFTTKPAGAGSGLGLSICRKIIEGYRGRIEVRSELGKGSCFTVWLPAAEDGADADGGEPASGDPGPSLERLRLLVVDDHPNFRIALRTLLEHDHEVVACSGGAEAWELLQGDTRFDVILCDLMMPGFSGMELLERLRAIDAPCASRIVFMTGGAYDPATADALRSGAYLCLEKPFNFERLQAALRQKVHECGRR